MHHVVVQAPQASADRAIWTSAKAIMEASAQKFNLTDLSTRRDMSMLLAQSAVQVQPTHAAGRTILYIFLTR